MDALISLWLPILVSAVVVFFASSVIWMALPVHKKDYQRLGPAEDAIMSAVKAARLGGGLYMFPGCDPKALKDDPVARQKLKEGPWGVVTLMASPWNMGRSLGLWILNLVLIGIFIAYIAGLALPPGAPYLKVFQIVGATAFLAHGGGVLCDSIWKGRPWSLLPGSLFDAIVYALLTAGVFGWLWPKAA
ncbi:MAG: hypothetical protein ACK4WH_01175 [Phycisphaerales bacterium]